MKSLQTFWGKRSYLHIFGSSIILILVPHWKHVHSKHLLSRFYTWEAQSLVFLIRREGKISVQDHWPESITEQMVLRSGHKQWKGSPAGSQAKAIHFCHGSHLRVRVLACQRTKSQGPLQSDQWLVGPRESCSAFALWVLDLESSPSYAFWKTRIKSTKVYTG